MRKILACLVLISVMVGIGNINSFEVIAQKSDSTDNETFPMALQRVPTKN